MSDTDLSGWTGCPRPERKTLEGRFVRLEPLDAKVHGADLFESSSVPDAQTRFRWLFDMPPTSLADFQPWLEKSQASDDPLFFAVIDKATGKAVGRQSLMRIDPTMGAIEIGHIYWGPKLSRTPAATEAQFLFAAYAFDELGYRRYEWKCDNDNVPSRRAAARFGFSFDGLFRQHMVVKGKNRDTAWFSIMDGDWPDLRAAYVQWLDPENFDHDGCQKKTLEDCRRA
jgi:RimJ/RimL family protein N-acetyltransferase